MTARAQMTRRFDAPSKRLLDAVDMAFDQIGARGVRWSKEGFTARASMGFNFCSYGEDLTVEVFDDGEVEVRSQCIWPLQLIDWGKNARNCRRLLNRIEEILDDE